MGTDLGRGHALLWVALTFCPSNDWPITDMDIYAPPVRRLLFACVASADVASQTSAPTSCPEYVRILPNEPSYAAPGGARHYSNLLPHSRPFILETKRRETAHSHSIPERSANRSPPYVIQSFARAELLQRLADGPLLALSLQATLHILLRTLCKSYPPAMASATPHSWTFPQLRHLLCIFLLGASSANAIDVQFNDQSKIVPSDLVKPGFKSLTVLL